MRKSGRLKRQEFNGPCFVLGMRPRPPRWGAYEGIFKLTLKAHELEACLSSLTFFTDVFAPIAWRFERRAVWHRTACQH